MELLLTIKRDKRKVFSGHVYFMDQILIQLGKTPDDVKQKLLAQMQDMYEINPGVIALKIRSHHTLKAVHCINRLKKKPKQQSLEISFDSSYFTDI